MRDKWVLKHSLTDLRSSLGLSMEALAERAYTTNTTIFRIEKTGIIADPALAKTLASVFGLPVENFCSVDFARSNVLTVQRLTRRRGTISSLSGAMKSSANTAPSLPLRG